MSKFMAALYEGFGDQADEEKDALTAKINAEFEAIETECRKQSCHTDIGKLHSAVELTAIHIRTVALP